MCINVRSAYMQASWRSTVRAQRSVAIDRNPRGGASRACRLHLHARASVRRSTTDGSRVIGRVSPPFLARSTSVCYLECKYIHRGRPLHSRHCRRADRPSSWNHARARGGDRDVSSMHSPSLYAHRSLGSGDRPPMQRSTETRAVEDSWSAEWSS